MNTFEPYYVDVKTGYFNDDSGFYYADMTAPADAVDACDFHNWDLDNLLVDGKLSLSLNQSGIDAINKDGITQFRLKQTFVSAGANTAFDFYDTGQATTNEDPILVVQVAPTRVDDWILY